MPTIVLENVTKHYKQDKNSGRGKRTEIGVAELTLTIEQGDFVFVTGSSGAGKSTLLKLITGELKPDHGNVYLDGKDLTRLLRWSGNRARGMFGIVTQMGSLGRKMTVEENLMLAARIGRGRFESMSQVGARVAKVLGLVGMKGVEKRYPVELSIGECRRVELARALINSPPILVLDEITASLDDDNIWDIFHLLTEVNRRGSTVIMATHAGAYVNIMRKRVVTLVDGRVFGDVQRGRYGDVM